jgi:hypothetical protein
MGLLDRIKDLFGGATPEREEREEGAGDRSSDEPRRGGESLPGGASGGEAAATNPQRAAELAD